MPRLSLYRPEKGNDYKFIDKTAWEMFQVGGTDVLFHKYIGPDAAQQGNTPSTPEYTGGDNPFNIQDMLFLENRDRKYDPDVYLLRGVYNVQDIDFNLSQFGLFLQNDTIFITFHINDTVKKLGRKIIAGDVIELPHLKDEYALNDLSFALKRFYVVEEVNRAAEGFSVTWYPHLYRAKCKPLVDSQEFKQILDGIADTENYKGAYNASSTYYPDDIIEYDGVKYTVIQQVTGVTPPDATYYRIADSLRDIMSTYDKEMQITQAVLDQAEEDSPRAGYDTTMFWTLQPDPETGRAALVTADSDDLLIPSTDQYGNPIYDDQGNEVFMAVTADTVYQTPEGNAYPGYLVGDGLPSNGAPFTQGIAYPLNPIQGQYHLRTDYMPNRLFRFDGARWVKIEDNVRMTMSNLGPSDIMSGEAFEGHEARNNQKSTFINNNNTTTVAGKTVNEKQSLSKALRPEADN